MVTCHGVLVLLSHLLVFVPSSLKSGGLGGGGGGGGLVRTPGHDALSAHETVRDELFVGRTDALSAHETEGNDLFAGRTDALSAHDTEGNDCRTDALSAHETEGNDYIRWSYRCALSP